MPLEDLKPDGPECSVMGTEQKTDCEESQRQWRECQLFAKGCELPEGW